MHSKKVIEILKTFSKSEIIEFRKFLVSPFFHNERNIVPLFDALMKYYPDFENKNLSDEFLYLKIRPGEKYNEKTLKPMLSYLITKIDEYLAFRIFKKDKSAREMYSVVGLLRKGQLKNVKSGLTRFDAALEKMEFFSSEHFHRRYVLNDILLNLMNLSKDPEAVFSQLNINTAYSLGRLIINISQLSEYYFVKSRELNSLSEIEKFGTIIKGLNPEQIFENLKNSEIKEMPAVEIYYYCMMFRLNGNAEEYFNKAYNSFKEGQNIFASSEKFSLLHTMMNICIELSRKNKAVYSRKYIDLIKLILKEKLYTGRDNLYFSPAMYNNTIKIGLYLDELQWTEDFCYTAAGLLEPALRMSLQRLGMANIYIHKNEYREALRMLSLAYSKINSVNIDIKGLRLICLYELKEADKLIYEANAFKKYTENNKLIHAGLKKELLLFVKVTLILEKLRNKFDPVLYNRTELEINETPRITNKSWLINKLKDIDNE